MKGVVKLLFHYWKEEQMIDGVSSLPKDFDKSVKNFLAHLEEELDNPENGELQGFIIQGEMERITFMWEDLLKLRKKKIDALVATGSRLDGVLLEFENEYYSALAGALDRYKEASNIPVATASEPMESTGYLLLRFLEDMKEIMGIDLRVYGPFKKEDLVYLPRENAQILLQKEVVREVAVS